MATVSINLYNFDLPEHQSSQYILTSPRSLQACRQLDVRPIDLLPKSEYQLAEERPHLTAHQLKFSIQRYEGLRLRNLKAAKELRESIVRKHVSKRIFSNTDSDLGKTERKSPKESPKQGKTEAITTPGNEANLNDQSSVSTTSIDSNSGKFGKAGENISKDKSLESLEEEDCEKYESQIQVKKIDKKVKEQNNKSIQIAKSESLEKYETGSEKEIQYKNKATDDSKRHHNNGSRLSTTTSNISRHQLSSRSRYVRPSSGHKKQRTRRTESPFVHNLSSSASEACSVILLPKPESESSLTESKKSSSRIRVKNISSSQTTTKTTNGNIAQKSCFWESARIRKPKEGE